MLEFPTDETNTNPAVIAWRVLKDGKHIANVTQGLVTNKLKIYDAEYQSCIHEIPAIDDEIQFDAAEKWLENRENGKK